MTYEYKTVAAPEKVKKQRGAKTRTERVAVAFQEILNEHCSDGWEYLRTDIVPLEERSGFFSKSREVHRAVLIFRRAVAEPKSGGLFHRKQSGTAVEDEPLELTEQMAPTNRQPLPPLPPEYDDDPTRERTEPPINPERLAR